MEQLVQIVSYLAIISVASERLTDIIKRLLLKKSNVNGGVYQLISCGFGMGLSLFNPLDVSIIPFDGYTLAFVIGLVASGGSSLWHEILVTLSAYNKTITETKTS